MNRNRTGRFLIGLLLTAVLCGGVLAADMMPPDMMGPPPEGGPGGPPGGGESAPEEAAIVIVDGEERFDGEYDPGAYVGNISQEDDEVLIDGLELQDGDYSFNGLSVSGPDSLVRLQKANIHLMVDTPASGDETGGTAATVADGAMLFISDSNLVVDGAARYVTANLGDGTLVVNNSLIQSTGSVENTAEIAEPFSNEALLISGTARANFSIGATKTYYLNSTCVAEGWAALSTDSATGSGLDLYAYNSDGIAENGGYGTYADTNCRVWLYGSRLTAAEIGAIISKSGSITLAPAEEAPEEVLQYNEGSAADGNSRITGGRNAVMIHAPDMMGQGLYAADCGSFSASGGYIGTSQDLVSTKDYNDYGPAVGAYIDYVSGSDILIRSTSAVINLEHVEMESYNGTLVHTVLNADSMGNFLAPGDGDMVSPVWVSMHDMEVTGDIRHEDYQRRMLVELKNTTLTGNIISGTMDSWNALWKKYGDVNWVVDDSFDAVYGAGLNLLEGSVWNVTGESTLTSLTVAEGSVLNGTVVLDGEELVPEPDITYTGAITVTGSYTPEPLEEPEAEPQQEPADYIVEDDFPPDALPDSALEELSEEPESEPASTDLPAEQTVSRRSTGRGSVIAAVAAVLVLLAAGILFARRKRQ